MFVLKALLPLCVVAQGFGLQTEPRCPPGHEFEVGWDTCTGGCDRNMHSQQWCGFSFIRCLYDCHTCWKCKPVEGDSERTKGIVPSSLSPEFGLSPGVHGPFKVITDILPSMEDCISRNLLFEDMWTAWQSTPFQIRAGAELAAGYESFGMSYLDKQACLDGMQRFIPPRNYSLTWVDQNDPSFYDRSCFAFGIYHFIQNDYIPTLGVVKDTELSLLGWKGVTQYCPLKTFASWELRGVSQGKKYPINTDPTYASKSYALHTLNSRVSRLEGAAIEDETRTLKSLDASYRHPKRLESLVTFPGLPWAYLRWLGGLSPKISAPSYSRQASIDILSHFALALENTKYECLQSCPEGQKVYTWQLRTVLENGNELMKLQSPQCRCIDTEAPEPACPPSRVNGTRCSAGSFWDLKVDQFFSSHYPTKKQTPVMVQVSSRRTYLEVPASVLVVFTLVGGLLCSRLLKNHRQEKDVELRDSLLLAKC
mmetsp:Transcript_41735/g.67015  ORF Transcript_41735/g.67015 Transcript_41735/m.67015 type:complete len:481 (-) Transcript_41735:2129-3571(-)